MPLVFIKALNCPCSHLIIPPSTHLHSIWAPCPAHHITDSPLAGPSHMFLSGLQPPCCCVMCPPKGITHPSHSRPAPFHSTWSFITTGYPEHFTFPSVVQQMCSTGTKWKRRRERERAGNTLSQPVERKHSSHRFTCMCFLFSRHVRSHVCSLPLCRTSKVTVGLGCRGLCPKATGWLDWLRSRVCGRGRFWPNLNGMFLWWLLSGLVSVSYSPSWWKLCRQHRNAEKHWADTSVLLVRCELSLNTLLYWTDPILHSCFCITILLVFNSRNTHTHTHNNSPPSLYLKYHLFTPPPKSPKVLECAGRSTMEPQCVCIPINKGGGGECGWP